jgi:hypothetical protein
VQRAALAALEPTAVYPMILLGVTDERLDRLSALEPAPQCFAALIP